VGGHVYMGSRVESEEDVVGRKCQSVAAERGYGRRGNGLMPHREKADQRALDAENGAGCAGGSRVRLPGYAGQISTYRRKQIEREKASGAE